MAKVDGKLGVAVIGLGVGEQHASAYSRLSACELRWLYDLDWRRVDQVTARLGQGAPAKSFSDILSDRSVQAISIATYDDAHFEQVVTALQAGKHVFVEKPLCRSAEEVCSIKQAWKSAGHLTLMSNLVLRAAPLYEWLRNMIADGLLGEIYAFDGDYLFGRIEKITKGWRSQVKNYSVMQGGGVHLVDLMLWLTQQRPVRVSATGNKICTAGSTFRYHDFVSATFQFGSSLIGRITANFGCVHRHQHVVRVFGTKGALIYDDLGARWHSSRDPALAAATVNLPALPLTKGDLIPHFVKSIIEGADTRAQTQHELDVMSACIAADQALASMTSFPIEYV